MTSVDTGPAPEPGTASTAAPPERAAAGAAAREATAAGAAAREATATGAAAREAAAPPLGASEPAVLPLGASEPAAPAFRDLESAPELAPYRDEPAQLPSGAPGKVGALRLRFAPRGGRTVLTDLYRQSPLLVQRALYWDEAMPELACVFILTTSGGVLQGDRLAIDLVLEAGARAHVTTQSATKIQEMDANYAVQRQRISLAEDAYLEYLPEPVIPYRHSRFLTHTEVTLPESATLLYAEIYLPGRKYYRDGEIFAYDLFSSTLSAARPAGPELFVERFLIEPARFGVDRTGVMGGFHVFATVLLLTAPDRAQRVFDRTEPVWDEPARLAAGANRLPHDAGLVYRVLGMDTEPVRARVREFCALARRETVGRETPPAFRWR